MTVSATGSGSRTLVYINLPEVPGPYTGLTQSLDHTLETIGIVNKCQEDRENGLQRA